MWYIITMKDEKYYRVELQADGKKETTGWDGFDEANNASLYQSDEEGY